MDETKILAELDRKITVVKRELERLGDDKRNESARLYLAGRRDGLELALSLVIHEKDA